MLERLCFKARGLDAREDVLQGEGAVEVGEHTSIQKGRNGSLAVGAHRVHGKGRGHLVVHLRAAEAAQDELWPAHAPEKRAPVGGRHLARQHLGARNVLHQRGVHAPRRKLHLGDGGHGPRLGKQHVAHRLLGPQRLEAAPGKGRLDARCDEGQDALLERAPIHSPLEPLQVRPPQEGFALAMLDQNVVFEGAHSHAVRAPQRLGWDPLQARARGAHRRSVLESVALQQQARREAGPAAGAHLGLLYEDPRDEEADNLPLRTRG